jgi:hypothetical protein
VAGKYAGTFLFNTYQKRINAMTQDKLIYTDGHDVTVTESTFKVKNAAYRLNGITKLCLWTIRPDRWPGVLLLLLGLAAVVCGIMGVVPPDMNLATDSGVITGNELALYVGAGLALIGIVVLAASKERYAVRIATAEGEKNAVVSRKREYIAQIVDALHSAFDLGHTNTPVVISKK